MVVKVGQQIGGIKIIDLSLPSKFENLYPFDIWKFIMTYPFIVACSVKVCQTKDKFFKEEYIIPQMLTEYVIENNYHALTSGIAEQITAIKYTSTHYNRDFYSDIAKFTNLAVPIIDTETTNKYCPKLKEMFLLSDPTCFYYEEIRGNLMNNMENENLLERMENILHSYPVYYVEE